jgi:hypothetical protein
MIEDAAKASRGAQIGAPPRLLCRFSANHEGPCVMISLLILAAIALPNIDLPSNCRAQQKAIPPNPNQVSIYDTCMNGEQAARERVAKKWGTIPPAVRATCADIGRLGGSYVEMDVCIEIDTGQLSTSAAAAPRAK